MNDDTKQHADASADTMPQGAEGPGGQGLPSLHEVIDKLEAERSDLKDKLLRALADMENMRRRTEKEVADARTYAISKFAADMLGVADNMGRAHKAVPDDVRANADATLKTLLDGVELVERDMLRALERHGVRQIDPKGEKFDPNFHQAMFELPDPSLPNGTVAQVMQVGYVIGDRVLRPALVGVARGGPKVVPPSGPAAEPGATVDKSA
jgi:molecular chaperone GrpE